MKKVRDGIFERVRGSGVWWVRLRDCKGRLRVREVGDKAIAQAYLKLWRLRERALRLPEEAWKAIFHRESK